jgi:Undecaprenyl-phosphate galactose phosphotransferase WbaP
MATREIAIDFPHVSVQGCRPEWMIACLLLCDALSLAISGGIAVLFKLVLSDNLAAWHAYVSLLPLLLPFLIVYSVVGLYTGASLGTPEELRRFSLSSIFVSLFSAIVTFSVRGSGSVFTVTMLNAVILSLVIIPTARAILRLGLANKSWWGYPTIVFGEYDQGESIIQNLIDQPSHGLKPVGFFCSNRILSEAEGTPIIGEAELARLVHDIRGPAYAVFASTAESYRDLIAVLQRYRRHFHHILVVPPFDEFPTLWINPKNIGGMLGLEICQQVLIPSRRLLKRSMDLVLSLVLVLVFAPLMIVIAVATKLDSPGPVFYRQRRIGRGGREFVAWKFRTMVVDADRVLQTHLDKDPSLQEQWNAIRKLKNDPRTTRFGRFLRRTSLDELPQLWNVLRGEMSLVGPRPIVHEEIARYGADYEMYTWVPSGLTGLWQVSGRNDTSYRKRVAYDRYYVQNWSVWLDICILFRTVGIVISRVGAF